VKKFKAGDRVKAVTKAGIEIIGTITKFKDGYPYLVLDSPVVGELDGRQVSISEGYIDKDIAKAFEIIERTDWESLWDDAADSTSDE